MNVARRRAGAVARACGSSGTVQGVGFRPYVYRLASELGLVGFVYNDSRGVVIEVEGSPVAVDRFLARLPSEAPPLAVLEEMRSRRRPRRGRRVCDPRERRRSTPDAPVTPDTATCADCLRELFDPADRRYRYPFINCTNCGPRFTIVRGVPYDRPLTTMAAFTMCAACRAEYEDPADRRFHAQPNACPACGPAGFASSSATGDRSPLPDDRARRRDRRPPRSPRARSSRSRASAATTSRAAPATSARSRRCGRASTARTSRSR